MYFYKTKRFGGVLVVAACLAGGLYRSAHSLSFNPPQIHKTLLKGQSPVGWHARYSSSSLQAVQDAFTKKIQAYYNQEKGLSLNLGVLRPDYRITVNYTEKLDHTLSISIQAHSPNKTKEAVERHIRISSNASLLNRLEAEALDISQHLAKAALQSS